MINIIFCDYCGWKKLTKDFSESDLVEVKNSSENQIRKFKCQKCGRLVRSRKAQDPQKDLDLRIKKENQKEQTKIWTQEVLKYREEFQDEEN
jgi:DNA-directed RNA polymerase subunit RPC12/RpoP